MEGDVTQGRAVSTAGPGVNGPAMRTGIAAAFFAPIAPPTAFEQTVERLGSAIRLGILPLGSRLPPERDLAEAFSISRTTLRQGIVALVQAGLLVSRRGRGGGTWVAPELPPMAPADELAAVDWNEVLSFRLAVESGSALLAAKNISAEVIAEMEKVCDGLDAVTASEGEYIDYRRADAHLHLLLAEASGSARLVGLMTEAQDAMSGAVRSRTWPRIVLERANAQHRELLKALRAGKGGRAAEILYEHIEGSRLIGRGMGIT